MVPNMSGVHASIIAASHRRHERERQEEERKRRESRICTKNVPCKYCWDYFDSSDCPKEKVK